MFHKPAESREQKIKRLANINAEIAKTLKDAKLLYTIEENIASQKLVEILDELLKKEEWDSTLLLKTAKKRLMALRDQAQKIADEINESGVAKKSEQFITYIKEGYVKVYISLYQTQGTNLKIWHEMLKSLAKFSITRPVYEQEEDVREVIRSKPDMQRHGYAIVAIEKSGIIEKGAKILDNFGHELLTLKEGAVKLENIIEFVHANSKHYVFSKDKLVLKS